MKSSLTSSHPSIRIISSFLCVPLKFFSLHCDFNIYSLPPSNTISCFLPNKLLKVKVYVLFFFVFSQHLTQDILYSKKEKKLEDNASRVFHTRILDLTLEKWKHFIHMSLISQETTSWSSSSSFIVGNGASRTQPFSQIISKVLSG